MKVKGIGSHVEFGHWLGIIRHLRSFQLKSGVVTELLDHGCTMNQWRNRPEIGSPHSPLVKSHLSAFERP